MQVLEKNKTSERARLLRIGLASLYLSIIIFLPFLHDHPVVLGQAEPAHCPENAFVVTSSGTVNHVITIVIVFFSFIYLIPAILIKVKYVVPNPLQERAPPAFAL